MNKNDKVIKGNEPDAYGRQFWIINIDGNDERAFYGTEDEVINHNIDVTRIYNCNVTYRLSDAWNNLSDFNLVGQYYI